MTGKDDMVVFGFHVAVQIPGSIPSVEDFDAFQARHLLALFLVGPIGSRFYTTVMRDIVTVAL